MAPLYGYAEYIVLKPSSMSIRSPNLYNFQFLPFFNNFLFPSLHRLGQRLVAWNALLQQLATIQLSPEPDKFRWNLHKNGEFSVDSMYNALIYLDVPVDNNKMIWKMKIPLKTKVFGWYLHRGVILTKDNLAKRN
jgi:hypothetical protein